VLHLVGFGVDGKIAFRSIFCCGHSPTSAKLHNPRHQRVPST
jgi:hypothetical protein